MSIIVRMRGGLGNQLFQWAFARSISSRLKTSYLIDWAPFSPEFKVHKYSLDHFAIKVPLATNTNMFGFVWVGRHYKFFNTFYRLMRFRRILMPFYYPERTFAFDPVAFSKTGTTYFDGFWQTEKYFKDIVDEIRAELTLVKPLSLYSKKIEEKILKTPNAISLHVRRADLVHNPIMTAFHGYCSPEFYAAAIERIVKDVPSPHFFIFSDDYEWVVEHFKSLPYPYTCIKNGADKNYEDLYLMSKCRHHIISNSSFGWWGAWLNPRKDKIVIAPSKWFVTTKNDTRDLLPEDWIKI